MRTARFIYFVFLINLFHFQSQGQQTTYFDKIQNEIEVAKHLFDNGKYIASFREFEKIQQKTDSDSELFSEAEFYKSVSALQAGYSEGSKLIRNFLDNFGDSPYANRAAYYYGDYLYERRQYSPALREFRKVKRNDLPDDERIKLQYQMGFSLLMNDDTESALGEFMGIMNTNNIYSKPATYYWAHIMYLKGNYDQALDGFRKLEADPSYNRVIPLYVSHIFYKQEKYRSVVDYTSSVIDYVDEENKGELSKLLGDSWFHLGEYGNAIPWLEAYFKSVKLKTREENYILGYCYYATGEYEKASGLFRESAKGKDEMAQNAYYHLADCYIKQDEKEKAKLAYSAASGLDFDENIKEDALFQFAKLTYELSYSPFNETIKAFDNYIALYPSSVRNEEAYRILTEVYMVTRNYKDAIQSIEKIKVKTPSVLKAYQRVTFYRGLELFNNLAYNQAIDFFDTSLESGGQDPELSARAMFWKAESLFRVGDYNGAVSSFTRFIQSRGARSVKEYSAAEYNLAYSYYKLQAYDDAVGHFKKFVQNSGNSGSVKSADALNRIGDYYFQNSSYPEAVQYYRRAYDMKLLEADYALFQIAFCRGLQRDQKGKIADLERLLVQFPESDYEDDVFYELGRAYERTGRNSDAERQYDLLTRNYPQSSYYRKAVLQLGLISYNDGDFRKALSHYKKVAENFTGTPEARTALLGIKNCYIELNNIDAYFSYAESLGGGSRVTATEQDSLTYLAAEKIYMSDGEGAAGQLQDYLRKFPNGSFTLNASFYLAEILYKEEDFAGANKYYTHVASQPDNVFSETALSMASELTFNEERFTESLELFNRLENVAGGKWNVLKANTGQMRCNFILENYSAAVEAAGKVKRSAVADIALVREANYTEGKSYYKLDRPGEALPGLKMVSDDTKFEQGAEAKYLVAEIYYQQDKKKLAEDEIMDFVEENSPYQFWLGKSFLLLTDIYMDNGDDFTAKHTLKSIVENYGNDTDGIKEEASRKLTAIEAREAAEQKSAVDSSFQIEIKQN